MAKFQPGQSGNPGGRPKGAISLSTQLRKALKQKITLGDGTKMSAADVVIRKAIQGAMQGDVQLIRLIFDRIDGKIPDQATTPQDTAADQARTLTVIEQLLARPPNE